MRDALVFPTSLTPEEKKFKEMQENLKNLVSSFEGDWRDWFIDECMLSLKNSK